MIRRFEKVKQGEYVEVEVRGSKVRMRFGKLGRGAHFETARSLASKADAVTWVNAHVHELVHNERATEVAAVGLTPIDVELQKEAQQRREATRSKAKQATPARGSTHSLLEQRGLWSVVFMNHLRDEDVFDDLFGDAPPPRELAQQPRFEFELANGWKWVVIFNRPRRGGFRHLIVNARASEEEVASLDGHPTIKSQLSMEELMSLARSVRPKSSTPAKYLVPLLVTAAAPAAESEREALESYFVAALRKAKIAVSRNHASLLAQSLRLTTRRVVRPKRTPAFAQFLDNVLKR